MFFLFEAKVTNHHTFVTPLALYRAYPLPPETAGSPPKKGAVPPLKSGAKRRVYASETRQTVQKRRMRCIKIHTFIDVITNRVYTSPAVPPIRGGKKVYSSPVLFVIFHKIAPKSGNNRIAYSEIHNKLLTRSGNKNIIFLQL